MIETATFSSVEIAEVDHIARLFKVPIHLIIDRGLWASVLQTPYLFTDEWTAVYGG